MRLAAGLLAGACGGRQWPMGVVWGPRAGSAVSWRPLPGPAGACSALEEQRCAAWPPARLPATHQRRGSALIQQFPRELGTQDRLGPVRWAQGGAWRGQTPGRGGCARGRPGFREPACCFPGAHSLGLGLWVSCPLGPVLGDVLGDVGGWPSACVRPVPELVPGPAVGGQRCWRAIPSFLGSPVAASWRRAGVVEGPRWQTVHGDAEGPLGGRRGGRPALGFPICPQHGLWVPVLPSPRRRPPSVTAKCTARRGQALGRQPSPRPVCAELIPMQATAQVAAGGPRVAAWLDVCRRERPRD